MDSGAINAEEDPVGDGSPGRVLGVAIEAHLRRRKRSKPVRSTSRSASQEHLDRGKQLQEAGEAAAIWSGASPCSQAWT